MNQNPLAVINGFKTSIRNSYSSAIERHVNNTIEELNNEIIEKINSLRIKDWKNSLDRLVTLFGQTIENLPKLYDRSKITNSINELNSTLKTESDRYRRLKKNLVSYRTELKETYCDDIDSIIEGYLDNINVYRMLFSQRGNKGPLLSNVEAIKQYFKERNRNAQNVDSIIKDFINNETNRFRDLDVERAVTSLNYKCNEIDQTFDHLSRNVDIDRNEAMIMIAPLIDNLIVIISDKNLFRNQSLDELVRLLSQNYGIQIDISVEGMGSILPDEVITKIYNDCITGNADRNYLLDIAATLNINEDFSNVDTQSLCNYIGKALGLTFY